MNYLHSCIMLNKILSSEILKSYYVMSLRNFVLYVTTHERIRYANETQCDTNAKYSLHTHNVSTADVIKAVKRLKSDKHNDDGIIMSNNFQHGKSLIYTRTAQLFSAMLYYGYASQLFLRFAIITIPHS